MTDQYLHSYKGFVVEAIPISGRMKLRTSSDTYINFEDLDTWCEEIKNLRDRSQEIIERNKESNEA